MVAEDIPGRLILNNKNRDKFLKGDTYWKMYTFIGAGLFIAPLAIVIITSDSPDYLLIVVQMLMISLICSVLIWLVFAAAHQNPRLNHRCHLGVVYENGIETSTGKYKDSLNFKTKFHLISNNKIKQVAYETNPAKEKSWVIAIDTDENETFFFDGNNKIDVIRIANHFQLNQKLYKYEIKYWNSFKEDWDIAVS
jgi:hypothetical protein